MLCGTDLDICDQFSCNALNLVLFQFDSLYNHAAWLYPDCEDRFAAYSMPILLRHGVSARLPKCIINVERL